MSCQVSSGLRLYTDCLPGPAQSGSSQLPTSWCGQSSDFLFFQFFHYSSPYLLKCHVVAGASRRNYPRTRSMSCSGRPLLASSRESERGAAVASNLSPTVCSPYAAKASSRSACCRGSRRSLACSGSDEYSRLPSRSSQAYEVQCRGCCGSQSWSLGGYQVRRCQVRRELCLWSAS